MVYNSEKQTVGKQAGGQNQFLNRAVAILEVIAHASPITMTQIAEQESLSTSTVHRALVDLTHHGLVTRSSEDSTYTLGPRFIQLAHAAFNGVNLASLVQKHLQALRDATGETSAAHIPTESRERVVLTQVESKHDLRRTYTEIGQALPIHQGAAGKVLLAHLPKAVQEEVLGSQLEKSTRNTITDVRELRAELKSVRAAGYALSQEERVAGVISISAPVFNSRHEVVAALSVSGPASRVSVETMTSFSNILIEVSSALSIELGGPGCGEDKLITTTER